MHTRQFTATVLGAMLLMQTSGLAASNNDQKKPNSYYVALTLQDIRDQMARLQQGEQPRGRWDTVDYLKERERAAEELLSNTQKAEAKQK